MIKNFILIFILFFSNLLTFGFSTDISACPATINFAAYYNVTAPLSTGASCFNIQSDDVEINCNNFLINGSPSTGAFAYANGDYSNITIRNCNVKNFDIGIIISDNSFFKIKYTVN
jgi:hypothetical protein